MVRDGLVTEGAVSNVMVVQDGKLVTAPEGGRILSGVTRPVVLELARHEGLTVQERYCSEQSFSERRSFSHRDDCRSLGRRPDRREEIGTGRPGPLTQRLAKRFLDET